jgi:hypothetical protein
MNAVLLQENSMNAYKSSALFFYHAYSNKNHLYLGLSQGKIFRVVSFVPVISLPIPT